MESNIEAVEKRLWTAADQLRAGITQKVRGMVAGAAPPAAMIEGMAQKDQPHDGHKILVTGKIAVRPKLIGCRPEALFNGFDI